MVIMKVKNACGLVQELTGFDKHWFVGISWYLPTFTLFTMISAFFPDLKESILIFGTQLMPNYTILPLMLAVPLGKMFKIQTGLYGDDFSREYAQKLFYSVSAEMIGIVLATLFSILALLTPWMTNVAFQYFIVIGGFTIPVLYNVLAKWHVGQSVIVKYFQRKCWKYRSNGAPF